MEGADVLDTEILYWTKWHIGTPMAIKPRSTRGVGALQDSGIHGITWDPPTRSGTEQSQTTKGYEEYHMAYDIDFDETDIDTFIARRPDGLVFDEEKIYVCF